MEAISFSSLTPILPELFLACSGLFLLVLGVLKGNSSTAFVSWLTILVFAATLFIMSGQTLGSAPILNGMFCLLYTSPSPRDLSTSRMPSSA